MSISDTGSYIRNTVSGLALGAAALVLAGCSSMGSFGGDPTITGSTSRMGGTVIGQSMPGYIPPANIGGGSPSMVANQPMVMNTTAEPSWGQSSVISQDLPALQPSSVTSTQPMQTAAVYQNPAQQPVQQAASQQQGTFQHTIASGESLYTIARRYDVSPTDIVSVNGLSSPDRITVGQRLTIPGRADLLQQRAATTQVAAIGSQPVNLAAPTQQPAVVQAQPAQSPAPVQTAAVQQPSVTPSAPAQTQSVTSDKFRWPLSGRVITDFTASKGTGINIEAPEGTTVRAAETGEVIYVGNAVEGYGNLILVKHNNGFVSAYAHLKNIGVVKGDSISRGDSIGTVGATGSVSRPQLHFELRKGATPIDPMPHLAG